MLATQAGVNITVAQNVTGETALSLHNQKFGPALDDLCDSHNLRFHLKGNGILVEKDHPFVKTYRLPFLNGKRESQSQISLATDVFSSGIDRSGRDTGNGSNSSLKFTATNDLWQDVKDNITMILKANLPDGASIPPLTFSTSEAGGLVSVQAPASVHKSIDQYFQLLNETTNSQVLIEVKIIDVELNDEFQSGINWHTLKGDLRLNGAFGKTVPPGAIDRDTNPELDVFRLGGGGRVLQGLLGLLNRFGTVRTLSSPRLIVLNNQSAMMKVATNRVFFRVEYAREPKTTDKTEVERAYSQIHTVPVGFLMTVRPAVDTQTGKITLHLRPTMSRVSGEKKDPAVGFLNNQKLTSEVPEIQVREMETTLGVHSGETIAIGGLMEERADNTRSGIPGPDKIPLFSPVFSGKTDSRSVSELVIFLRASLVQNATTDTISPADRQVYKNFYNDPRGIL